MRHTGVSRQFPNATPWQMLSQIDSEGQFLHHSWQLFCHGTRNYFILTCVTHKAVQTDKVRNHALPAERPDWLIPAYHRSVWSFLTPPMSSELSHPKLVNSVKCLVIPSMRTDEYKTDTQKSICRLKSSWNLAHTKQTEQTENNASQLICFG